MSCQTIKAYNRQCGHLKGEVDSLITIDEKARLLLNDIHKALISLEYQPGDADAVKDETAKRALNNMKMDLGEDKVKEIQEYTAFLRKRHPNMGPKNIQKKVLNFFKIKLIK